MKLTEDEVTFIEENLKLAYHIADKMYKEFKRQYKNLNVNYEDIEQIALLTLCMTAQGFDKELGNKFSTYYCRSAIKNLKRYVHKYNCPLTVPVMETVYSNRTKEDERQEILSAIGGTGYVSLYQEIGNDSDSEDRTIEETLTKEDLSFEAIEVLDVIDKTLTPRQKEIFFLNLKYSQVEIADMLGVSRFVPGKLMSIARSKIKRELVG